MNAARTLATVCLLAALQSCAGGGRAPESVEPDRIVTHRVLPGETWESISEEFYGTRERAGELARFNGSRKGEDLDPGTGVKVPLIRRDMSRIRERLDAMDIYNEGVEMAERGDYPGAVRKFEQALDIEPGATEASFNLAVTLQKMGRHKDALAILEDVIEERPERAEYHFAAGNSLFYIGRYDEAVDTFRRALRYDPAHLESIFSLAASLERLGRKDEAIETWEYYIEKAPEGDWTEEARRRLDGLRRKGSGD